MKMNKIIIPAAMLAVGVALVGSVSSTLAWYQYSTKAQAAYIGTSAGVSENLQIQKSNGDWVSNLTPGDIDDLIASGVGTELTPITPAVTGNGNLSETAALPGSFYNSVETGVAGVETYGGRTATNKNYVQFTLNIRYVKTNYSISEGDPNTYAQKALKLIDLTIIDESTKADLSKAVRVHFSTSTTNNLFMKDSSTTETVETATYGKLDTDNDGHYDKGWVYEWDTTAAEITYGANGSIQTAYNSNVANLNHQIGVLPSSVSAGLAVTVTIWLEGWQKLSGVPTGNVEQSASAMWNPTIYANKTFKVGMRFQADDIQQNP